MDNGVAAPCARAPIRKQPLGGGANAGLLYRMRAESNRVGGPFDLPGAPVRFSPWNALHKCEQRLLLARPDVAAHNVTSLVLGIPLSRIALLEAEDTKYSD